MINTKFWNDGYVAELEPVEKLLFLYLLTNRYTEMCGAYELSIRTMVFETGIPEDVIRNVLSRFGVDGKVEYRDGWVIVKNFLKHQQKNPNIAKGILRAIEELPESIKALIAFETDTHLNLNLNLNSNSNALFDRFWEKYPKKIGKADALRAFKKVNPSEELTNRIISAVESHRKTDQWKDNDGRYIPYPATFLNRAQWEDEIAPKNKEPKILDWEKTDRGMKPVYEPSEFAKSLNKRI